MARRVETSEDARADNWFSFKKLLMGESEDMSRVRLNALFFGIVGSSIGLEAGNWLIDPATLFGGQLGAPAMAWGFILGGVSAILGAWLGKWEVDRRRRRRSKR